MKYTVYFTDEKGKTQIGDSEYVEAINHEEAAQKFVLGKSKIHRFTKVLGGWGDNKVIKIDTEEEKNERLEEIANEIKTLKEQLSDISYFELSAEKRDSFYQAVSYLSAQLEVRALEKEEIEFLKAWHQLKDRELGEALLTKNEMSKPKSEQGKSAFSKTAWAAGFAMQGMATQNALNDIADDVSDISDGGSGFD